MDLDRARDFLRTHHAAVLGTLRGDGGPQLTPVIVGVDDEGRAVVSTRETAMKTRNLRRTPRAWMLVMENGIEGEWIQVEGDVEIVPLPEAMEGLVSYYRGISGEHPDWDDYRAAMERQRRVLLRITLTRAGPDRSG
jgi:PPOX class probable F420-dependent enzyme